MTRNEYFEHNSAAYNSDDKDAPFKVHRAYYAQFVTPAIKDAVSHRFSVNRLQHEIAADQHINGIELRLWDSMEPVCHTAEAAMRACGDFPSLGNAVCILKEAARQLVEEVIA